MNEWQDAIDYYSLSGFEMYETKRSLEDWGNKKNAIEYVKKYWLTHDELDADWDSLFRNIFMASKRGLYDMVFADNYMLMAFKGGSLFMKDDFAKLKRCMHLLDEKYFVVIENTFAGKRTEPPLRFKFPVTISWKELSGGAFISTAILNMLHKDFFVFGDSGNWGKYLGNDYCDCLEVIGFRKEAAEVFLCEFDFLEEAVAQALPSFYLPKMVNNFR